MNTPGANSNAVAEEVIAMILAAYRYVVPADVREVFVHTVAHRLVLSPRAQSQGKQPEQILREILESVDAPRLR